MHESNVNDVKNENVLKNYFRYCILIENTSKLTELSM